MIAPALLGLAIACETVAVLALRASEGFTRFIPTLVAAVGLCSAAYLMSIVARSMPISIVYATWSAVGTAVIAAIGIVALGEPGGMLRLAGFALIIVGVGALHLSGGH